MSERTRRPRQHSSDRESVAEAEVVAPPGDSSEQLKADLDGLLDEIDEVLETNAEEFVRGYVQKGGE